jgi:hypothetical protein
MADPASIAAEHAQVLKDVAFAQKELQRLGNTRGIISTGKLEKQHRVEFDNPGRGVVHIEGFNTGDKLQLNEWLYTMDEQGTFHFAEKVAASGTTRLAELAKFGGNVSSLSRTEDTIKMVILPESSLAQLVINGKPVRLTDAAPAW